MQHLPPYLNSYDTILTIHRLLHLRKLSILICNYACTGMMIAAIMYASTPKPPAKPNSTQANLIIVGSTLMYSAIPAHTPQIILLFDLYNLFCSIIEPPFHYLPSTYYNTTFLPKINCNIADTAVKFEVTYCTVIIYLRIRYSLIMMIRYVDRANTGFNIIRIVILFSTQI